MPVGHTEDYYQDTAVNNTSGIVSSVGTNRQMNYWRIINVVGEIQIVLQNVVILSYQITYYPTFLKCSDIVIPNYLLPDIS